MNTPEDIIDQVELYLRGELDTAHSAEIAGLIQSDPAWKEIHAQMLLERRGIRFHSLQSFKNNLIEYEAELTNQEKNQEKGGDLSHDPAYTYTTKDEKGVEVKTQSHEMEENYSIDKNTAKGIRYTALQGQLDKLKQEEKGMGGSVLPKKNGGRVVGMRRYWWAVAAGVMVLVIGRYLLIIIETRKVESLIVLPEEIYTTRSVVDEDIKTKAYLLYSIKNYKNAYNYFKILLDQNKLTLEDELFYAFCLLKLNQFNSAENLFLKLKRSHLPQYDLDYYIALCYIYSKQYKKALNIIESSKFNRDSILNQNLKLYLNNKIK